MKPVAWRYENKNVKGNWYITWTEPPDGFNKRPLYEHPPQDAANSCLYEDTKKLEQQLAASEQDRQDQIDLTIARAEEVKQLRQQLVDRDAEIAELADKVREECAQVCEGVVCGSQGMAGPSRCILKPGHDGPHRYGVPIAKTQRECADAIRATKEWPAIVVTMRMTQAQRELLRLLGGAAWVRRQLEQAAG